MPHRTSTAPATGLAPVPVAVLLPPPAAHPHDRSTAGDLTDWYGVAPRDVAGLVAHYSRPGDLVIEVDGHRTITRAASHLGRHPALWAGDDDVDGHEPRGDQSPRRVGAGLIFVALPGPGTDRCDLAATRATMPTWQAWLRPGGYLLTALMCSSPRPAGKQPVSFRAGVIAAAHTVGFTWQQEFLVLTAAPPEYEPRALSDAGPVVPSALVAGRHQRAHIKVLAFRHDAGGRDA